MRCPWYNSCRTAGSSSLLPCWAGKSLQTESVPLNRKLAANSLAVCRELGRPFSSGGFRIGPPWNDSDTRGCGCSGDHGYLKACWPKNPQWGGEIVEQLYVGIDVSSTKHAAYLMKPDGDKFSSFPMQNDRSGAKMISEKIVSALTKLGLKDVVIGMEATSIYGDNLVYALREDGNLGRFHRKIHVLNPKQVKNFKKLYQ